ncbi:NAC domain-containing protein 2-like isoform X2 [Elaeis guineensis]|uniref:NAC domain-containing protein 2-like isoform X2 n=1 Tax=Elaeis guineensis var. tenera TaxID=51953 RepID=UPI003C6CFBA6
MEMDPENIEAVIHQRYGVPEGENSGPSLRFPPGFNFNPNDQELIRLYLDRKIKENYKLSGEEKFYFFTSRTRKYPNGSRPARAAAGGYWKATGSEKKIYNDDDELVRVKKTLVYYREKAKENDGVKTDRIMQEYISEITTCKPGDSMKLDDWVLCCIHKKRGAVDIPHKLQNVSQAQLDMPTEQDAKNNQSYQIFIDSKGGYGNAIMVQ